MRRLSRTDTLVVATHNKGKMKEINDVLAPLGLKITSVGELGLPVPEETEATFRGNASLKALAAAKASGHPALADDSGLCVDALGGDPGVYSADWAGNDKDFARAMQRVQDGLTAKGAVNAAQRKAHFLSCLCLAWPDGHCDFIEGRIDGTLIWPPRGTDGFGYDPMFLPDGETRTFGEMTRQEKNGLEAPLSHRARAMRRFQAECLPQ